MERNMRLRPYRQGDGEYVKNWIRDEESHMKWCANTLPYGFAAQDLEQSLLDGAREWGDMGFTATDRQGVPVGFLKLSINERENTGFMKCIIVDGDRRGQGLGQNMLELAAVYAFQVAGVREVRLIVFDDNPGAVKCYTRVGFVPEEKLPEFEWNGRGWGRTRMLLRASDR